jgi:hypothetical protein
VRKERVRGGKEILWVEVEVVVVVMVVVGRVRRERVR